MKLVMLRSDATFRENSTGRGGRSWQGKGEQQRGVPEAKVAPEHPDARALWH